METYQLSIEKGVPYGEKIIIGNAANDYIDKTPSDLVFIVKPIKHPFYRRRNKHDLQATLTLSLKEALLGFEKKIKTLDNRFITLKNEGVTQPF